MSLDNSRYDSRAVSLGGYGTLVPYHGFSGFDPSSPGQARYTPLPIESPAPVGQIQDHLNNLNEHLDVALGQGELYYTLHWQEYGFHSSGLDNLTEDLEAGFDLGEELAGTLEARYEMELDMHRPCFTILSSAEYGLFYLLLRGAIRNIGDDDKENEIVYYTESGVLIDQPVTSWPNIEKVRESDGGPITQQATDVMSTSVKLPQETPLRGVVPLDQSVDAGDADIIAARNPFDGSCVQGDDEDLVDAVERTSRLTFRVRGGTIGFEDEDGFSTNSMSVFRPTEVTMWGAPLTICFPQCSAQ